MNIRELAEKKISLRMVILFPWFLLTCLCQQLLWVLQPLRPQRILTKT